MKVEDLMVMQMTGWARNEGVMLHNELNLWHHNGNGEKMSVWVGKKRKQMGLLAGMPDFSLAVPRKGHASLQMEFKVGKNTLTESQKIVLPLLADLGNLVCVVRDDWKRGRDIVLWYLGEDKREFEEVFGTEK